MLPSIQIFTIPTVLQDSSPRSNHHEELRHIGEREGKGKLTIQCGIQTLVQRGLDVGRDIYIEQEDKNILTQ